jgi:hypothetical protein
MLFTERTVALISDVISSLIAWLAMDFWSHLCIWKRDNPNNQKRRVVLIRLIKNHTIDKQSKLSKLFLHHQNSSHRPATSPLRETIHLKPARTKPNQIICKPSSLRYG